VPGWTRVLALVAAIGLAAFALWNLFLFATGENEWPVGIVGAALLAFVLFRFSRAERPG
jgi:hypothetical protein